MTRDIFPRQQVDRRRAAHSISIFAGCMALVTCGMAVAQTKPDRPGGFWKCRTQSNVKGEFGGEDPVGLAAGKHIPTDCSVRLGDGHGKTFCFASMPSREFFDSELGLRAKAEAFWAKEHGAPGTR